MLLCIFRPDLLNDPDVRRFYTDLMQSKSKSNLSGPTTEVKLKVRIYLQTRVSDYNWANHFLAEIIRHTIFKQQSIFFHLHSLIISNKKQLQHDAHTLFYALKRAMKTTQKTLVEPVIKSMRTLTMKVDRGVP